MLDRLSAGFVTLSPATYDLVLVLSDTIITRYLSLQKTFLSSFSVNPKSTQQADRKRKFTISQLKIYSSASNELSKDDKHEATRDSASDDVNTDIFETAPQSQISRKVSTSHTRTTNPLMSKAEENRGTLIGPPAPEPKSEPAVDELKGPYETEIAVIQKSYPKAGDFKLPKDGKPTAPGEQSKSGCIHRGGSIYEGRGETTAPGWLLEGNGSARSILSGIIHIIEPH
jgi:Fe-S cluster assembly DRE2-like protein